MKLIWNACMFHQKERKIPEMNEGTEESHLNHEKRIRIRFDDKLTAAFVEMCCANAESVVEI